jgi:hypothetical protein
VTCSPSRDPLSTDRTPPLPAGASTGPASATGTTVSGPGGFAAPASLVGAKAKKRGSVLVARYRVAAPGGTFDAADNGSYTVRLGAAAVTAHSGDGTRAVTDGFTVRASAEQDIGTFQVAANTGRRPAGVVADLQSA